MGRDVTRRDRATGPTARDPATGRTARDDHPRRRVRRRAIPHATGHTGWCDRQRTIRHATSLSCPEMPGNARNRTMFGYARICPVMPDDVSLPGPSGDCFTGCERPNAEPQLRRWQLPKLAGVTAYDEPSKTHQISGRASGVNCRRCWAAF